MDIHVFMDISLQLSMLLWISILISFDFYGYPCIELLWILDPGYPSLGRKFLRTLKLISDHSPGREWAEIGYRKCVVTSRKCSSDGRRDDRLTHVEFAARANMISL